jgi:uncharacterized protein YjbI with pentapeptide repeats
MPEKNKSGSQLQRKSFISKLSGKAKSFTEYFEDAEPILEGIQKYSALVGEVPMLSVLKVFSRILSDVTKIDDPEELGYYACKIAFLDAFQIALNSEDFISPVKIDYAVKEVEQQLREINLNDVDFAIFKLDEATTHCFLDLAEKQTDARLIILGFSESQRNDLILKIRDNFEECLRKLFTKKDTFEKFSRFKDYIELDHTNKIARKNLALHSKYQIWQYTLAPVLGREPFALKDVFVEPECGFLLWKDIHPDEETHSRKNKEGIRPERKNPFDEEHGGRHKMIDLVMQLIAKKDEKEPIIIQGFAGSGKTSFTLRLCERLIEEGLSPIRVRLRDITLSKNIEEALPQAVRLSNEEYVDKNPLISDAILKEKGVGAFSEVSRYVLILDGWDELSVSASEGFKAKVEKMLEQLKNYIKFKPVPLKIILTGRPSTEVTDNTFLKEKTPILTVRDSSPEQLEQFINKITEAAKPSQIEAFREKLKDAPKEYLPVALDDEEMPLEIEDWAKLTKDKFTDILETYRRNPKDIEVLGLPLLAHLASRLIAVWEDDALRLVHDKTLLYRNLINLTCEKAGKASVDDRDDVESVKEQSRFWGNNLRKLLWGTASAMSIFGEDSISHDELQMRLESEQELKEIVDDISEKNWLSSLLISFYFKGGSKDLGCEFSHKSFREYLFAEAIVEALKDYGREAKDDYSERANYWEDFDEKDERYNLSRRISKLFASSYLTPEVYIYLENLLRWEIKRSTNTETIKQVGIQTDILDLAGWQNIREGLTDLWNWWMFKVPLRLQPTIDRRGNKEFSIMPFVYQLINHILPKTEDKIPETAEIVNINLGKNFFVLTSLIYEILRKDCGRLENRSLKSYQSLLEGELVFSPFISNSTNSLNESLYQSARLSIEGATLGKLDFSARKLINDSFAEISLQESVFSKSIFYGFRLSISDISFCQFNMTRIDQSDWFYCTISNSNFSGARIRNSRFNGCSFNNTNFSETDVYLCDFSANDLSGADFTNAGFRLCDFSRANCENIIFNNTSLIDCSFHGTSFLNADLSKTVGLIKEQLENADINAETKLPKNLEQYKEHFIRLTEERWKANESDDVELVEIDAPELIDEE